MDCDKLIQNINPCATTSPFRRWDEVGYIVPYADVKNIVFNGMTVNFDTIGTAFSVRDRRPNPFSGSGSEFVRGDMGSVSWTERVNFPALANSVENATIANAIANGGRVVVILKQIDYESDGKGKYQVFGIDGGLRIDSEPFDPYADAAWNITLMAEKMSRPAVYLWDTDEATTDAKWSLITQYEYITGLSLASGTVTPQQVTLFTNSTPSSYVILPDGSKLTTNGSGEINTTWAGAAGAIIIVIPRRNLIALSDGGNIPADFIGQLIANTPETVQIDGCVNITSVITPLATVFSSAGCTSLESLSAPVATSIDASGCALTEAGLITLVTGIWNAGTTDGTMDISGGTSAEPQGIAEPYATYYSNLVAVRNWTVTANT